jgi:hypothetical protein|tara:strand:+ start:2667 stop:3464 length:798 start_codon:yes stop_codon:yes gene_type:complete
MGLSLKSLLPVIGGIAGAYFGPAGSAALNTALGSGIGTLVAGGDAKDAIKNAIIGGGATAGLGAMGVGPGAAQSAAGKAATEAAAQQAITEEATKQAIASEAAKGGILGSGISVGDVVVGSSLLGMLGVGDEDITDDGPRELESRPDYKGTPIKGIFRDTVTDISYDTAEELEEAIKKRQQQVTAMALGGIVSLNAGGLIEGPGTGTSDSIKAGIYQNGKKVQEARLSDEEFVMTRKAVAGAGNGDTNLGAKRMYAMMDKFERMA